MQSLIWLVRILVVVVLVWFAARNSHTVTLYGMLGQEWPFPLALLLLIAFAAGVFLGLAAGFPTVFRLRRKLAQRDKEAARDAAAATAPAERRVGGESSARGAEASGAAVPAAANARPATEPLGDARASVAVLPPPHGD